MLGTSQEAVSSGPVLLLGLTGNIDSRQVEGSSDNYNCAQCHRVSVQECGVSSTSQGTRKRT